MMATTSMSSIMTESHHYTWPASLGTARSRSTSWTAAHGWGFGCGGQTNNEVSYREYTSNLYSRVPQDIWFCVYVYTNTLLLNPFRDPVLGKPILVILYLHTLPWYTGDFPHSWSTKLMDFYWRNTCFQQKIHSHFHHKLESVMASFVWCKSLISSPTTP